MRRPSSKAPVLVAAALAVLFSESLAARAVTYMVTVNTSSQSGAGLLDFQFNPGVSSQAASASVSTFTPVGGLSNAPAIAGNVTGTLPPSITLTNSTPFNDDFVGFNFGGSLSFLVSLSGPAISTPNSTSISGSSFGFSIYKSDGVTPLLTGNSDGFAFEINVNPDGTTTVNNFSTTDVSVVISSTPQLGEVYVTNSASNSVSVIDTSTNTVKATIGVGFAPLYVALSPDGSRAYAANSVGNSVTVINTSKNTVAATVPVGHNPVQLAVSTDGGKVYVANTGSNSVSVINTSTNTVIATVTVGHNPVNVAISADDSKVYVANTGSNSVSVISTTTNAVVATIPVGFLPSNMATH
jgi:YVTN family beta-propeller protein